MLFPSQLLNSKFLCDLMYQLKHTPVFSSLVPVFNNKNVQFYVLLYRAIINLTLPLIFLSLAFSSILYILVYKSQRQHIFTCQYILCIKVLTNLSVANVIESTKSPILLYWKQGWKNQAHAREVVSSRTKYCLPKIFISSNMYLCCKFRSFTVTDKQ